MSVMDANSIVYKARPRRKNYKDTGQELLNRGRAERRQKLLVDRRRIPMSEVMQGPNMESVDEKPAGSETAPRIPLGPVKRQPTGMEESKKRAATKRIEQLREWKKERELVKMKNKEKYRKPFIPAGLNHSSIVKLNAPSILPGSSHTASISRKPESSVAATRSSSSGLSLRNRTVKPPVPEKPVRLKRGMCAVEGEKESSRKPRPPVVTKPAKLKPAGSSGVNKSALCNGSVKGAVTRQRAAAVGKPAMGRNAKAPCPASSRTLAKVDSLSKVSKPKLEDSNHPSVSENESCSQVGTIKSSEIMASPKRSLRNPLTPRPPLAPKPSAKVLEQKLITVNDPAWIPNQKLATPAPTDSRIFERTFGKNQLFSPYVFTGGKKKNNPVLPEFPGFTFRLESVDSPDFSMREEKDVADMSTTSLTAVANDSASSLANAGVLNISDSSQEKVNATISHNNEVANRLVADDENAAAMNGCPESPGGEVANVKSQGSRSSVNGNAWGLASANVAGSSPESAPSHPCSSSKTTLDPTPDPVQSEMPLTKETEFSSFRNLHDEVCRRWQLDCDKWNDISTELESQKLASEEALDLIRTTVCQSQLLMRSKLKQYLGLVTQAEERRGEKVPTAEDLQGFWDMVYLQVEDIDKKFADLDALKSNNWHLPKVSKPAASKSAVSKPRRSKRLVTATSPQSSNPQAVSDRLKQQRAKRAAARSKFLQMKAASAAATRRESLSEQDKEKEDDTCSKAETEVTDGLGPAVQMQTANHVVVQSLDNTTLGDSPGEVDGAFVRKYVSIKPTKKLQEMLGTDCILSPAKRSLRIHRKSVGQSLATESASNNSIVVSSLTDLPHNLDYVIHPNPSLQ